MRDYLLAEGLVVQYMDVICSAINVLLSVRAKELDVSKILRVKTINLLENGCLLKGAR